MEQFCCGSIDRAINRAEHIAAMKEAIASNDGLVLAVPHKELLEAVWLWKGIKFVNVDLLPSASTFHCKG